MASIEWNHNLTLQDGTEGWLSYATVGLTEYAAPKFEPEAVWFYPVSNAEWYSIRSGTHLFIGSFAGRGLHHWLDFPDPDDDNQMVWRKWTAFDTAHQWVIWAVNEQPEIDSTTPFHLQAGRGHGYIGLHDSLPNRLTVVDKDKALSFIASPAPDLRGEATPLAQLFAGPALRARNQEKPSTFLGG